ncbi:lipopolysaccharide biosynthesis protein [Bifidobacterium moukalabense]|uniref:lipopolysaccharide biosynthesis protein n=1 Tax=Bifidobacterium moukalabense TaxID=1333651 RepID=UPI001484DA36|nr:oligosaccharide flippase family protein [Bifidobacterium moukalabense]
MNIRKLLSDFSVAVVAQGLALLASVSVTLLLPKIMGVVSFGYWQLFMFYATYVGFFHLGLNDGVYLINGGRDRSAINKSSILSQFFVAGILQTIFAFVIVIAALFGNLPGERSFVIIMTALFMLPNNLALYIGYVFQAMNETKLFSFSSIVDRLVFFVPMISMLLLRVDQFEPYIIANCFGTICRLLFCLYFFRDFLRSKPDSIRVALKDSVHSISVGVKLMIATIASSLILGVGRAIIDMRWGIEAFGKFSLSLSMVTFFLNFVLQASMVLFPALRQTDNRHIAKFYKNTLDILDIFFPAVYLLYFPMAWILSLWLPQYQDSLTFLAYLLPICVFDSKMNIACVTLMKVRREETRLLVINIVSVAVCAVLSLWCAYLLNSMYAVVAGMVIAIIGRSIYSEWYMSRALGLQPSLASIADVMLSFIFIILTVRSSAAFAFCAYLTSYLIFLFLFRDNLKKLKSAFSQALKTKI